MIGFDKYTFAKSFEQNSNNIYISPILSIKLLLTFHSRKSQLSEKPFNPAVCLVRRLHLSYI